MFLLGVSQAQVEEGGMEEGQEGKEEDKEQEGKEGEEGGGGLTV